MLIENEVQKLRGLYNLTSKRVVIPMDIFGEKSNASHESKS